MAEIVERFENVTVLVKANIFEGGLCQSRTLIFQDGSRKTLGVYMPGELVFESHDPERVLITSGSVEVLFPAMQNGVLFPPASATMFLPVVPLKSESGL